MAAKKNAKDKNGEMQHRNPPSPRPFWSGTVSFGLVSLPVSLFAATRSKRVALRMIDKEGTPLARRYFCPRQQRALDSDEIVRGYQVGKSSFVVVKDEELDAVAPEKSREMDLLHFVPVDQIDPMRFVRAYVLAPEEGAIKPYRLLATSMQDTGRAGIATCVIRGKEYLIAILANDGILRAEILRFAEELRTPEDVGLPAPVDPDEEALQQMQDAIAKGSHAHLDRRQLRDRHARRILECVGDKLETGEDVIHAADDTEADAPPADTDPLDLMALLKDSLKERKHGADDGSGKRGKDGKDGKSKRRNKKKTSGKSRGGALRQLTRDDLYAKAQKLEIPGRSRMNKDELAAAIEAG